MPVKGDLVREIGVLNLEVRVSSALAPKQGLDSLSLKKTATELRMTKGA